MQNWGPLPKNTLLLSPGSLQTYLCSKAGVGVRKKRVIPQNHSMAWVGRVKFCPSGQNLTGHEEIITALISSVGPLRWPYNNVILCMLMKIQNQIGHIKLLNALSVPEMSFPKKKGNHCWSDIVLYFLGNTHGIATCTWKCSALMAHSKKSTHSPISAFYWLPLSGEAVLQHVACFRLHSVT